MHPFTCDSNMSVGLSLLNNFKHLFRAADKTLCCSFHIDHLVLVLMNSKIHLGR